ncbi:MAG TPA: N-acetylmuramoyl-L-alanine amidase [Terriglobales bacterium]|jgi:N-acetylmuramoyl-L-alanine amidase|nr:N-acetylmuramoyl-L-alanine amidase [Terriglobales bacterium]
MPWSRKVLGRSAAVLIFGIVVGCLLARRVSGFSEEKRLAVYSSNGNYSLPVSERNGTDYIGLLEILQPLGTASARLDGRIWRLHYNDVESEFTAGGTRARIHGRNFDLPTSFLLENGRGLVPLSSLPGLMPQFLSFPVNFHETSRRLFIGNVAVHFTAQVIKSNPPSLVMQFSSPVNPMIATEPGKLRMVFTREPLVPPGSQRLTFDSTAIPSATFQENNGAAEIAVSGAVPLFASFSGDGKTITIRPAPQAAVAAAPAPGPAQGSSPVPVTQPATSAAPPQAGTAPAQVVSSNGTQYFAVVDASHGGNERGAELSDQLAEKDVTLAFALRLRQELLAHNLPTLLLRSDDTTLSLDQRAGLTNIAHPAVYICLHAASQGTGVRLYTALLPVGGEGRGPFLGWDRAQSAARPTSLTLASSLAAEFGKRQVPVRSLTAPLRPLNSITTAAVAIEIAPPAGKISNLNSPAYQQLVSEAVSAGIEAVEAARHKPGAQE